MVDDREITERRQVRGLPVLRARADESNRSWDDARDQEFVVEYCGPVFLIGIDLDVGDLEAGTSVVGSVAVFPPWVNRLLDFPGGGGIPGLPRAFDFLEIRVWVSLNVLFGVGARHGGC